MTCSYEMRVYFNHFKYTLKLYVYKRFFFFPILLKYDVS